MFFFPKSYFKKIFLHYFKKLEFTLQNISINNIDDLKLIINVSIEFCTMKHQLPLDLMY